MQGAGWGRGQHGTGQQEASIPHLSFSLSLAVWSTGPSQDSCASPRTLAQLHLLQAIPACLHCRAGTDMPMVALGSDSISVMRIQSAKWAKQPDTAHSPRAELAKPARVALRLNMACGYPRILYLWIFLRLQGQKHTDISVNKTTSFFGHTGCRLSKSGSQHGACMVPRNASMLFWSLLLFVWVKNLILSSLWVTTERSRRADPGAYRGGGGR